VKILLDLQSAQTISATRGIGRYSLALAKAMIRNGKEHQFYILLSSLFPERIDEVRAEFDGIVPQDHILVAKLHGPVSYENKHNDSRRIVAEWMLEAFIHNINPDIYHNFSLFEGIIDNAVTSVKKLSNNITVSVTIHDLIPWIHSKVYLEPHPISERWYFQKINDLRRADLWLANSECSRQEGINYLGLDEEDVFNVLGSIDEIFKKLTINEKNKEEILGKFGITKPFVMYTGGIDFRKNIDGLIKAFANMDSDTRKSYQLAIVCSANQDAKNELLEVAADCGLQLNDVLLTGFVSDDDLVALYNLCHLFVFPSWHEGFGLPVLEAMRCGAPVIGANTSSLPEIIGMEEALFDPFSIESISASMEKALVDSDFRARLLAHAAERPAFFSWDESGLKSIKAFEHAYASRRENLSKADNSASLPKPAKPRLIYVSPLRDAHTGIADYSAALLPYLDQFYEIEVVTEQEEYIRDRFVLGLECTRSSSWLRENHFKYDRILYHIGNSSYHAYMFDLLRDIPGVVVLHDFYLGHIQAHRPFPNFQRALYFSHGYNAVVSSFLAEDIWEETVWEYPANLEIIENAKNIIVHSDYALSLSKKWYGKNVCENWDVIPHLKAIPKNGNNKISARKKLNIIESGFTICSFGDLSDSKMNDAIIKAFSRSSISKNEGVKLVFVGNRSNLDLYEKLRNIVSDEGLGDKVVFTGRVDSDVYLDYLQAADLAIQLRTKSRGESSGTVLDVMAHGIPVVINDHGPASEINDNSVAKIKETFDINELATAIDKIYFSASYRNELADLAKKYINDNHAPKEIARRYFESIESSYFRAQADQGGLIDRIAQSEYARSLEHEFTPISRFINGNKIPKSSDKNLFVDISVLKKVDAKTGVQRVTRSILSELFKNPPVGYRIEPVYSDVGKKGYFYARKFSSEFLKIPDNWHHDEPVDFNIGDILFGLDLAPHIVGDQIHYLNWLRDLGVKIQFLVHDLIPVLAPDTCPAGTDEVHAKWLRTIAEYDGAICVSRSVAEELYTWLDMHGPKRSRYFSISWIHNGADIENSSPTYGLPANAEKLLGFFRDTITFLMVGTIEPRKGYDIVLQAFEETWERNIDVNLVIVGKVGWNVDNLISKIETHPQLGKKLYWMKNISDEYLEEIYSNCSCLIAASDREGFGLPLIEAARHGLPILARDIPVFREVAKNNAAYFDGQNKESISSAICEWTTNKSRRVSSSGLKWKTWREATNDIVDILVNGAYWEKWRKKD